MQERTEGCLMCCSRAVQVYPDEQGHERDVREVQELRVRALPARALQRAALPARGHLRRAAPEHREDLLPKVPGHLLPALKVPGAQRLCCPGARKTHIFSLLDL